MTDGRTAESSPTNHPQVLRLVPPWILVAVPVVALLVLAWSRRWMSDDGFINLRVVEQILAGNGPVFNAGERVEIATSPVWIVILAAFSAVIPRVPAEWIAVILGIAATAWAVVAAQLGALRIHGGVRRSELVVPLGVIVLVALPPVWDFASSGLETGLSLAWMGSCWYLLADERSSRRWTTAVLCGVGPLVRPDLAVISAAFLVVLLVGPHKRPWLSRLTTLGAASTLPVVWQLFRMGYYGALVPNTAFAKEASLAHWQQGWRYFNDFAGTYAIAIPVVVVLVMVGGPGAVRAIRAGDRHRAALVVAPVVGGLGHWLYVVRVGGDFMHARLLLPGLFAIVLPAAAIRARTTLSLMALPAIVVWAAFVSIGVRSPHGDAVGPDLIADERAFYVRLAGNSHPVTIDDYARHPWVTYARTARRMAEEDRQVLILGPPGFEDPARRMPALSKERGPVVMFGNVGLLSYGSGVRVHVVDPVGLGDVIAGRQRLDVRGRPGHEKALHPAWAVARFADAIEPSGTGAPSPTAIAAARRALGCGELAEVLAAAEEPLDVGRFFANMGVAVRLHAARFPADPLVAVRELCP